MLIRRGQFIMQIHNRVFHLHEKQNSSNTQYHTPSVPHKTSENNKSSSKLQQLNEPAFTGCWLSNQTPAAYGCATLESILHNWPLSRTKRRPQSEQPLSSRLSSAFTNPFIRRPRRRRHAKYTNLRQHMRRVILIEVSLMWKCDCVAI